MIDYDAMTASLAAEREARVLDPALEAEIDANPMHRRRTDRMEVRAWIQTRPVEDRVWFTGFLQDIRQRWAADEALLDQMYAASFGDAEDRARARRWWDAGYELDEIADRIGWIYAAEVEVAEVDRWRREDGWPDHEPGDAREDAR